MLYKLAAVSAMLAVGLSQDDEEGIQNTLVGAIESTDSLDAMMESTGSIDATSLGDSIESSNSFDADDDSLESTNSLDDDINDDDTEESGDDDDDDDDDDVASGDDDDDDDDDTDEDNSEQSQDGIDVDGDDNDNDDDDDDDECVGLGETECRDLVDDDGDQECGYNGDNDECYSVERRAGSLGSGNYDDGFKAALAASEQEATQLYTVVGVLGGIIGALLLVMAGGGYYLHSKTKNYDMSYDVEQEMNQISQANTANNDDDGEELIQKGSNAGLESVVEIE